MAWLVSLGKGSSPLFFASLSLSLLRVFCWFPWRIDGLCSFSGFLLVFSLVGRPMLSLCRSPFFLFPGPFSAVCHWTFPPFLAAAERLPSSFSPFPLSFPAPFFHPGAAFFQPLFLAGRRSFRFLVSSGVLPAVHSFPFPCGPENPSSPFFFPPFSFLLVVCC